MNGEEEFLGYYTGARANLPEWDIMHNYYKTTTGLAIDYLLEEPDNAKLINKYHDQIKTLLDAVPSSYRKAAWEHIKEKSGVEFK